MRDAATCGYCDYFVQAEKHAFEKEKKSGFKQFITAIDPELEDAIDRALVIAEQGDVPRAEELMRPLFEQSPDSHLVQYAMGCMCQTKGQIQESISYFDRAVEISPYFYEAWNNLGTAYMELGNMVGSIKSRRKQIECGNPDAVGFAEAREAVAIVKKEICDELGLSLDNYIEAMELYSRTVDQMANGFYEQARDGFLKILSITDRHEQSYGNLGLCYSFLGEREKAMEAFDGALAIKPEYEVVIRNREILAALPEGENLSAEELEVYRG